MKKINRVLVLFSVILIAAVGAAVGFLWSVSRSLSLALVVLGAGFWLAAFLRFRSIEYVDDGEHLTICRGVFFHAETSLKKSAILYVTTVKFGSMTLFSVIHTASGAVVIFAQIAS